MANIAIIEDELVLSNTLEILFTDNGHQVKCFGDGNSFLSYLDQDEPEIVILDLRLPDMDGLEILKIISLSTNLRNASLNIS